MSVNKVKISEKLIKDYVKTPPSLKDQVITKLAIQLCWNIELKKDIIFESESLRQNKYTISNSKWDTLIEKRSSDLCGKLSLPPALNNLLIVRIRSIALQLFNWNRQQVMLNLSPLFADSLLTPSDWTAEMKLDEKKITKRLVQDERISVLQRYKMACLQCLEFYIHLLWNQLSTEVREDLLGYDESKLVQLWSYHLSGKVEDLIPDEDQFWFRLFLRGVSGGSMSTVLHCWDQMNIIFRQEILIDAAMKAVSIIYNLVKNDFIMYFNPLSSPPPFTDILCFILTQMSEDQRLAFFHKALQDIKHNVLLCFLQWPYLDLMLPIIEELWNILPEAKYENLLLTLANNYSNYYGHSIRRNAYLPHDYGSLMIELLEKAPDHFKRYVFHENFYRDTIENGELLYVLIMNGPFKILNIKMFQHIWQLVTYKEKRSFLKSENGKSFCCFLALEENWELFNSVLRESLIENDVAMFPKNLLRSNAGKDTCFDILKYCNEELLDSWLNWAFPSKQEIFDFILNMFFRDHGIRWKTISYFVIKLDCLDNLIKKYSPSEDATRRFKSRFAKIYSREVCFYFVLFSKVSELDHYLAWSFSSDRNIKRFKEWFVKEYSMTLCEVLINFSKLQDAEQFLTWGFLSEEAVEQFRQELFFFSGVNLQWNILRRNSPDPDSLIKWFKLSPMAIRKFKKEVLFRSNALSFLFTYMSEEYYVINKEYAYYKLLIIERFLRWGLSDEETAMEFKNASKIYLMNFSFSDDEVQQWVQQNWDKFISERLSDLSMK